MIFGYQQRTDDIWRMIVKAVHKKYQIIFSKQDIIPGYLLSGITNKFGINCDFKIQQLNRQNPFFVIKNTLPQNLIINFIPTIKKYNLLTLSPILSKVNQIINSQPNTQNFQQLVDILNLKQNQIPFSLQQVKPSILSYLCNFVPLGQHQQFNHIGIYDMIQYQPHTKQSTKISLLAAKWAAKMGNVTLANKIFQIKYTQNSFWAGQFNPAIGQFYDFFALYNLQLGNSDQSLKLSKSSLINSIKLTGANSLPTADKHYNLGNIYLNLNNKQNALAEYIKTRDILQSRNQTTIPQYGVILIKCALLSLNFGKVGQCVGGALQALRVFDQNGGSQQDQIQTFQLLSRCYQITKKTSDQMSVASLCSQKFNNTQDPKILQRMLKISLMPKLSTLNNSDSKSLLQIISKLQQLQSPISFNQAFNYLHQIAQNQLLIKKIFQYLQNITNLYQDTKRRDLLRKHKSLCSENLSQPAQMLVIIQAVATLTGYNFLNGALRQNYF